MAKGHFQLDHSDKQHEADFVVFPRRSYNKNFIMLQQLAAFQMAATSFPTCALRVYLFVLSHMDRRGYLMPVPQRKLAEILCYTHSTVWRGLSWLKENGWIDEVTIDSEVHGGASVLVWRVNAEHAKRK